MGHSMEIEHKMATNRFLMVFYRIADHFVFEWFVFGVIFLNCVCTVIEVIITDSTGLLVLRILNYIACGVYVLEAVIKVSRVNSLSELQFMSELQFTEFVIRFCYLLLQRL